MKTFAIASLVLVVITAYVFTNIWVYKLGQASINAPSTITKTPTSSDVLGESQSIVPPRFSNIVPSTPTLTTACDPSGKCNNYSDPKSAGCPVTFTNTSCDNLCSDPSKRCRDY